MEMSEYEWQLATSTIFLLFGVIRSVWFIKKNQSIEFLFLGLLLSILFGVNLTQQNLLLGLNATHLRTLFILGILIIFEPELYRLIRFFLSQVSSKKKSGNLSVIPEIIAGAQILANTKTGALLAFEREDDLGKLCQSGTSVNSDVKKELMTALFSKDSLTHDGGVIIKNGRFTFCSVIFPLTFSLEIDKKFGTRHRAAIGLTESTDAACLVVSEEEGTISLAKDGEVYYNLDPKALERTLSGWLSQRSYKRHYPVHRIPSYRTIESSAIQLRLERKPIVKIYDLIFSLLWIFLAMNIMYVSQGSIDENSVKEVLSVQMLAENPVKLVPIFAALSHLWFAFLGIEMRFDHGVHRLIKIAKLLIVPVWTTRKPIENFARVHVKRESKSAPVWSLYLEDKKGKKMKLDSAGWPNSLIATAKQIHEFLKIELVNHS